MIEIIGALQVFLLPNNSIEAKLAYVVLGAADWKRNSRHETARMLYKRHKYIFFNMTLQEYGYTDTPDFPMARFSYNVTIERMPK